VIDAHFLQHGLLAVGCGDGGVRVYEPDGWTCVAEVEVGEAAASSWTGAMALSSDGALIAFGTFEGEMSLNTVSASWVKAGVHDHKAVSQCRAGFVGDGGQALGQYDEESSSAGEVIKPLLASKSAEFVVRLDVSSMIPRAKYIVLRCVPRTPPPPLSKRLLGVRVLCGPIPLSLYSVRLHLRRAACRLTRLRPCFVCFHNFVLPAGTNSTC
jgi:hypothetical protein